MDKLISFALPLMLSGILQLMFNAVDIIVVGHFTGKQALAAVGSTTALINVFTNLFIGISLGANVLAARFFASGREKEMSDTVHTAILLALISGILMAGIGVISAKGALLLMGTPDNVIAQSTLYMRIYFLGMPFFMLYNYGAAILRAVGDTKRPLLFLVISGCANALLDVGARWNPLLVGLLSFFITSFVFYWWHRATHASDLLWRVFHQLHHSARRIEVLTSFYAHPLDSCAAMLLSVISSYWVLGASPAAAAVAPGLTAAFDLFTHADLRTPRWLGYVLQRPEMHTVHHQHGHHAQNYGLPLWDMLFGTANFENRFDATGVRDQVEQGRDYGAGFWAQQFLGLKRLFGRG